MLILSCFISAFSQFLLKKASQEKYSTFFAQYINFKVIVSYTLFFFVVFLNSYLLRYLPLVILNPVAEVLPFILSIFSGYFFFGEEITIKKIIGAIFIILGIFFLVI